MQGIINKLFHKKSRSVREVDPVEGYDLWAKQYDEQPGNLMLDLDEAVFSSLLRQVDLQNKTVADIGCGTGRHWNKIVAKNPHYLHGFDTSRGMLLELQEKFPNARVSEISNDQFLDVDDATFDIIISTLTVAHIKNLQHALQAWCRILRDNGDIMITDFHPVALSRGGRRTFKNNGQVVSIMNYIHPLEMIKEACSGYGLTVIGEEERVIDESVRHYYEQQDAMHVYNEFKGVPMIYGLHLKRTNGLT